ncbi:hypothetical protein NOF55_07530 [Rhizobiaceae bacterium BDR2-2]|uniref:Uncharacterized protein n=1 Tax=Ectorhizobium quercum TaxID=2965071 RepID=A0AAE3SVH0_9HYPH|nr:hypothetical protein [Ectorhizobium quercum]MCX8996954.1 hypothetical protein [Ectorhizobium quercum]
MSSAARDADDVAKKSARGTNFRQIDLFARHIRCYWDRVIKPGIPGFASGPSDRQRPVAMSPPGSSSDNPLLEVSL